MHETGARLTHDVKNLLQSLYTLISMAPKESDDAYAGLLQRQLPQLTKRLNATLEKLRAPEVATLELPVPAHAWWAELERRLVGSPVTLQGTIALERDVPGALFDSFVENGLENARTKSAPMGTVGMRAWTSPATSAAWSFRWSTAAARCPTRSPASSSRADRARRRGIGLYNAARQATRAGYAALPRRQSRRQCVLPVAAHRRRER